MQTSFHPLCVHENTIESPVNDTQTSVKGYEVTTHIFEQTLNVSRRGHQKRRVWIAVAANVECFVSVVRRVLAVARRNLGSDSIVAQWEIINIHIDVTICCGKRACRVSRMGEICVKNSCSRTVSTVAWPAPIIFREIIPTAKITSKAHTCQQTYINKSTEKTNSMRTSYKADDDVEKPEDG